MSSCSPLNIKVDIIKPIKYSQLLKIFDDTPSKHNENK